MLKRRKQKSKSKTSPAYHAAVIILLGLLITSVYALLGPVDFSQQKHAPPKGRAINNIIELQIALARQGFSPGPIDGTHGRQTKQALGAFQLSRGLSPTGEMDPSLDKWLRIQEPTHAHIELTEAALAGITPKPATWRERGQLEHFGYHSALEMVAERTCTDPDYIHSLNPQIDWSALRPGDRVLAPLVPPFRIGEKIAGIEIELAKRELRALDASGNVLFHCPVSIARDVAKRPVGRLEVKVRVENPNYTFNPDILTATASWEGISEKFIIQPGPNNSVGTVWLGLDRPSYGIHGTPLPEKVGRTESSGCFRLANWNAETLLHATKVGTLVFVLP